MRRGRRRHGVTMQYRAALAVGLRQADEAMPGRKPGGRLDGSRVRSLYSPLHDRNRRSVFKQAVIVLSLNSPFQRRHATRGRQGRPARRVERSLRCGQVGAGRCVIISAPGLFRPGECPVVVGAKLAWRAPSVCWGKRAKQAWHLREANALALQLLQPLERRIQRRFVLGEAQALARNLSSLGKACQASLAPTGSECARVTASASARSPHPASLRSWRSTGVRGAGLAAPFRRTATAGSRPRPSRS